MSREVRRVPLNWQPPTMPCPYIHGPGYDCPGWHYHPHFDESYAHALQRWESGKRQWDSGENPDALDHPGMSYEEWDGDAPDSDYYRPEWPEGTPLGWCYYETTSEGTPKSPIFATSDELTDWLATEGGMSREGARRTVELGWLPTGMSSAATGFLTGEQAVDSGVL